MKDRFVTVIEIVGLHIYKYGVQVIRSYLYEYDLSLSNQGLLSHLRLE
jgi:hypothetical protein